MSRNPRHTRSRFCARLLPVGVAATVGIALTGGAVWAALTATAFNTTAQSVTSATLSLTMSNNGNGFGTTISNMAPTDIVNRYVVVTNGAGLAAQAVTLGVADANTDTLTTDATHGLAVTVTNCVGGTWTATSGVCSGTPSVVLTSTPLATLKSTPSSINAGAFAAGAALNLQLSITLPASTEVTANGTPPGSTIQGITASLTWTFTEAQRSGTTTNS